jgi:hypothetical protein
MATFTEYKTELRKGVKKLSQALVGDFEEYALADTNAFLRSSEKDLKRWTKLLEAGEITEQDFTDLVQAKKALAELHELTEAGIGHTKLDRFRKDLISLMIDTAMKVYI